MGHEESYSVSEDAVDNLPSPKPHIIALLLSCFSRKQCKVLSAPGTEHAANACFAMGEWEVPGVILYFQD